MNFLGEYRGGNLSIRIEVEMEKIKITPLKTPKMKILDDLIVK